VAIAVVEGNERFRWGEDEVHRRIYVVRGPVWLLPFFTLSLSPTEQGPHPCIHLSLLSSYRENPPQVVGPAHVTEAIT
jgi:hypothetical protein